MGKASSPRSIYGHQGQTMARVGGRRSPASQRPMLVAWVSLSCGIVSVMRSMLGRGTWHEPPPTHPPTPCSVFLRRRRLHSQVADLPGLGRPHPDGVITSIGSADMRTASHCLSDSSGRNGPRIGSARSAALSGLEAVVAISLLLALASLALRRCLVSRGVVCSFWPSGKRLPLRLGPMCLCAAASRPRPPVEAQPSSAA